MTTILLIGGSDSSCGAGLFADHETLHDLAADAKTIITSVTAQSNDRFFGSYDMPIDIVIEAKAKELALLKYRDIYVYNRNKEKVLT